MERWTSPGMPSNWEDCGRQCRALRAACRHWLPVWLLRPVSVTSVRQFERDNSLSKENVAVQ